MYLLIPRQLLAGWIVKMSFTFHYVSINSSANLPLISSSARFTFHYVSINSVFHNQFYHRLQQFTFHYVSINSHQTQGCRPCVTHLHSTMYLLILPNCLCVLFNIIFTFHYVSINSPMSVSRLVVRVLIYIPLCIY